MNILVDLAFPDGTEYVAKKTAVYGGNQYIARIQDIAILSDSMGLDKTYQTPLTAVTLLDPEVQGRRHYRDNLVDDTNKYIAGISAIIRQEDGTVLRTTKVESWEFGQETFTLNLTTRIDMALDFTEKITTDKWADATPDAYGEIVPMQCNVITRVKCWLVNGEATANGLWLIGKTPIASIDRVEIGGQVILGAYYSLSSAVIGGTTYYYVNMSHGVIKLLGKFCYADVTTTTAYTPLTGITHLLSGTLTVDTNAAFAAWMIAQGYDSTNIRYYLDRAMSPAELLRIFCESFECWYIIDEENKVEFPFIDRDNISISKVFKKEDIIIIEQVENYSAEDSVKNMIWYKFNRGYQDGTYNSIELYEADNTGNWGEFEEKDVEFEWLTEATQATVTVVERHYMHREPMATVSISVDLAGSITLKNGELIQISHPAMKTPNPVCLQIIRRNHDSMANLAKLECVDRNYLYPTFYLLQGDGRYLLQGDNYKIIKR